MNKKTLVLTIFAWILPSVALADATVGSIVEHAKTTAFLIMDGVVIILWLVTGFLFLSANGDPAKLTKGRSALFGAVAGTIIAIVANYAVNVVGQAFGL